MDVAQRSLSEVSDNPSNSAEEVYYSIIDPENKIKSLAGPNNK